MWRPCTYIWYLNSTFLMVHRINVVSMGLIWIPIIFSFRFWNKIMPPRLSYFMCTSVHWTRDLSHLRQMCLLPLHYEAWVLMQFTHGYILLQKGTPQVLYAQSKTVCFLQWGKFWNTSNYMWCTSETLLLTCGVPQGSVLGTSRLSTRPLVVSLTNWFFFYLQMTPISKTPQVLYTKFIVWQSFLNDIS